MCYLEEELESVEGEEDVAEDHEEIAKLVLHAIVTRLVHLNHLDDDEDDVHHDHQIDEHFEDGRLDDVVDLPLTLGFGWRHLLLLQLLRLPAFQVRTLQDNIQI